MKRFSELTEDQQRSAVLHQFKKFKDLLTSGVVESERVMGDEEIEEYAAIAAEHSLYLESGEQAVEGIANE